MKDTDENLRLIYAGALAEYTHKAYREICSNPLEQFMSGDIKFIQPEIVS